MSDVNEPSRRIIWAFFQPQNLYPALRGFQMSGWILLFQAGCFFRLPLCSTLQCVHWRWFFSNSVYWSKIPSCPKPFSFPPTTHSEKLSLSFSDSNILKFEGEPQLWYFNLPMKTNNKRFPKNRILIHNLAWKGRVIWKSRQNIKLSKWNENVLDVGLKPKPTMLPGKCLDVTFYDRVSSFSAKTMDTAKSLFFSHKMNAPSLPWMCRECLTFNLRNALLGNGHGWGHQWGGWWGHTQLSWSVPHVRHGIQLPHVGHARDGDDEAYWTCPTFAGCLLPFRIEA